MPVICHISAVCVRSNYNICTRISCKITSSTHCVFKRQKVPLLGTALTNSMCTNALLWPLVQKKPLIMLMLSEEALRRSFSHCSYTTRHEVNFPCRLINELSPPCSSPVMGSSGWATLASAMVCLIVFLFLCFFYSLVSYIRLELAFFCLIGNDHHFLMSLGVITWHM